MKYILFLLIPIIAFAQVGNQKIRYQDLERTLERDVRRFSGDPTLTGLDSVGVYEHITSMKVYNVKDYGAVGDGSTNNTVFIRSARSAAESNNGILYFPRGTYIISDSITINKNIVIRGDNATLKMAANATGNYSMLYVQHDSVYITGLTFDGDASNQSQTSLNAITLTDTVGGDSTLYDVWINQCSFNNINGYGIVYAMDKMKFVRLRITNNNFVYTYKSAVGIQNCKIEKMWFDNNYIYDSGFTSLPAVQFRAVSDIADSVSVIFIRGNVIENSSNVTFELNCLAHKVIINGNQIIGSGASGFSVSANEVIFTSNYAENQTNYMFELNQSDNVVMSNNISMNNQRFTYMTGITDGLNYVINNNYIYGTTSDAAIYLRRTKRFSITNNLFYNCSNNVIRINPYLASVSKDGLISNNNFIVPYDGIATNGSCVLIDSSFNINVSNNTMTIYDTSFATGTWGIINIHRGAANITIDNNKVVNPYSSEQVVEQAAIQLTSSSTASGILIKDNYIDGFLYGIYNAGTGSDTSSIKIRDNEFKNCTTNESLQDNNQIHHNLYEVNTNPSYEVSDTTWESYDGMIPFYHPKLQDTVWVYFKRSRDNNLTVNDTSVIALWEGDVGPSATLWTDQGDSSFNFLIAAAVAPSYSNNRYTFNGSTQWMGTSGVTDMQLDTTDFTIEIYFKHNAYNTYDALLSDGSGDTDSSWCIEFGAANNQIAFRNHNSYLTGSVLIDTTYYYYFAITREDSIAKMYINTTEAASDSSYFKDINLHNSVYTIVTGCRRGADRFFDGVICEIRVSNKARTASERNNYRIYLQNKYAE